MDFSMRQLPTVNQSVFGLLAVVLTLFSPVLVLTAQIRAAEPGAGETLHKGKPAGYWIKRLDEQDMAAQKKLWRP